MRGKTVRLAHLSQELAELDPELRVRDAVEEIRLRIQVGDRELSAGQLLERLGFPRSGSGPGSATCPAASGAGYSCSGC